MVSSKGTNYANIVNKYKQDVKHTKPGSDINMNNSTLAEWGYVTASLVAWAKDLSSELELLNSLWGLGTE